MIERIKNSVLTAVMFVILMVLFFVTGCHHHSGGSTPPPVVNNPASYTYTATVVAQHQPGFFSCWNLGGTLALGTYMDYNHKHDMQAQLCKLVGNKVVRVKTFRGSESLYNLRPIDATSLFAPGEQGPLYGVKLGGQSWVIHGQHLRMGHYQAEWWHHDGMAEWVTTEKGVKITSYPLSLTAKARSVSS